MKFLQPITSIFTADLVKVVLCVPTGQVFDFKYYKCLIYFSKLLEWSSESSLQLNKFFIENHAFVITFDVSNARFFTFTLKTRTKAS